jgi:hypothetical protein
MFNKLKEIFPAFQKFRVELDLHSVMIPIIVKSYPFIPQISIKVIEEIAG